MRRIVTGAVAMIGLVSGALMAAELHVGPASGSTVVATFRQMGAAVDTPFTRFTGTIHYDPANPSAGSALIEVETASLDFGDPAYNAEVAKPSWFGSAAHPKAVFRSTSIRALGPDKLEATGTLTIKGRQQATKVQVTVGAAPAGNVFDGNFTLSRKAFGIGDPAWDGVLEDQVVVKFHFQARRR